MSGRKMPFKIREGANYGVTKATIVRFSFRKEANNVHRFNITGNFGFVHFGAVKTQITLGSTNTITIRTFNKRRLRHHATQSVKQLEHQEPKRGIPKL